MNRILLWGLLAVLVAPIVFLAVSAFSFEPEVLKSFWRFHFLEVLAQTFGWGVTVALLSTFSGAGFGYVFSQYSFPGKRWLRVLLILPLAFPAYVYAFIFLGFFDEVLRIPTKNPWLLVAVFVFATFPYTFLLSEQAFSRQNRFLREASESFGYTAGQYFAKVHWPLAFPLIAGGFFIVLMEFISDFGAVQIFGLNTFSVSIYKFWSAYLSFSTANFISLLLLFIVLGLLWAQGKVVVYPFLETERKPAVSKYGLWFSLLCLLWISLSVLLPTTMLVKWALGSWSQVELQKFTANSIVLGLGFAFLITAFCFSFVLLVQKQGFYKKLLSSFFQFGYAMPGTLLAVAVTIPIFYLRRWLPEASFGTLFMLAMLGLAWGLRFFKVGFDPLLRSYDQWPKNIAEAAESLSDSRWSRFRHVQFPLLKTALATSFVFLFLECLKELPIVLLTRPYGWETLTVKVFEYTAESEWSKAAVPSLVIVLFGFIGVSLLLRKRA